ncbi:MAG TPA: hydroxymethylbilane synthase [Deltaproteobacteria bacterium]|nr:hydroxymethylbilane synthase [Deltaproteobacteria bacterium]
MKSAERAIKIGTRGSALATKQAQWVKNVLEKTHPEICVELIFIKTKGDNIQDVPLAKVGGKGLFVKEIEEALIDRRVDLAVHSMKDVPAELPQQLTIGCIPEREDPRDVLVTNGDYKYLDDLPEEARIGTSSLRRQSQLLALRSDFKIETLRGNLDTRLKKLKSGNFDAIVLAAAGLHRMGWEGEITSYFSPDEFLPAIGQGALGIELRKDNDDMMELIASIHDEQTAVCVRAERSFLDRLEGGCQVPIGGYCTYDQDGRIMLTGLVGTLDGKEMYRDSISGRPEDAEQLGKELADKLLSMGAKKILEKVYGNSC